MGMADSDRGTGNGGGSSCDCEASRVRRSWPTRGHGKKW
jgi:hypothetical protein